LENKENGKGTVKREQKRKDRKELRGIYGNAVVSASP
jgi:hypothetical protein